MSGRIYRFQTSQPGHNSPRMLLFRFLVQLSGIWLAALLVPGVVVGDWQSLVVASALFAMVNMLIRPLAILVSCCLILATFGLFLLVVNTALFAITAWLAGELGFAFTVDGFWSAFFGALVISLLSLAANWLIAQNQTEEPGPGL